VNLAPYKDALARPGVTSLLVFVVLARMPVSAAPIVLTLHVVLDLDRGFASSGAVAAMIAVGAAIGAPVMGRGVDRIGLRPIVAFATVAETGFWLSVDHLPYEALVVASFFGGLVAIPIWSLPRQSLSAMLPPSLRQAGFSLDSMLVEISFAIGPALGIALLTRAGASITFVAIALTLFASGAALFVLNPPTLSEDDPEPADASHDAAANGASNGIRAWWTRAVTAVLLVTATSTIILAGTDVALTAVMRDLDEVSLIGVVFAVWCLASLVGGFVYGASRPVHPMLLLAALGGLCIPVMFATTWWLLALLLIPTGLFCAPVISSTVQVLAHITPAAVRGQVMGWHGSALILGTAAGAPLTGLVVDHVEPRYGFLAIGLLGVAVTAALYPITRGRIPVAEMAQDHLIATPAEPPAARPSAADPAAAR
jgi:MFS family permease